MSKARSLPRAHGERDPYRRIAAIAGTALGSALEPTLRKLAGEGEEGGMRLVAETELARASAAVARLERALGVEGSAGATVSERVLLCAGMIQASRKK